MTDDQPVSAADLKAEAARYHAAFIKANEAVTVREVAIERLTAERDRARDVAAALEGQVAAVRATIERWDQGPDYDLDPYADRLIDAVLAALDPDPADREERP